MLARSRLVSARIRLDRGGARVARDRMAAPPGVARGGRRGHAHPHDGGRCRGGLECGRTTRGRPVPRRTPAVGHRMARRGAARPHRRRVAPSSTRPLRAPPRSRQQLAERARRDRRQNRRLRVLLGVAGGLIVLLVGAGSVAVVSSQEANAQRDSASIEALVGTALALRSSERDVSALLAAEAYRRWPDDPRTRSGLLGVLQGAGGFLGNTILADRGSAFGSVVPGTGDVVIVTTAGDAAIRDAETGDVIRELDLGFELGMPRPHPLIEVSGDGRVAAVLWPVRTQLAGVTWYGTSPQSEIVAFDLESGRRIIEPEVLDVGTGALAVNADGSVIAIADARHGAVTLVSTLDGTTSRIAGETTVDLDRDSYAAAIAFDDKDRLLVGRLDDRVDVVDAKAASITAEVPVPEDSAHVAMAVGASGIVVAAGDRHLTAFDPDDGRVRWSTDIARPYLAPCNWLAVAEAVQRAYCGSLFGQDQRVLPRRWRTPPPGGARPAVRRGRPDRRRRRRDPGDDQRQPSAHLALAARRRGPRASDARAGAHGDRSVFDGRRVSRRRAADGHHDHAPELVGRRRAGHHDRRRRLPVRRIRQRRRLGRRSSHRTECARRDVPLHRHRDLGPGREVELERGVVRPDQRRRAAGGDPRRRADPGIRPQDGRVRRGLLDGGRLAHVVVDLAGRRADRRHALGERVREVAGRGDEGAARAQRVDRGHLGSPCALQQADAGRGTGAAR